MVGACHMEVSEAVFTPVKIENYKHYCFTERMAELGPPLKYREVMIAIVSSFIYQSPPTTPEGF